LAHQQPERKTAHVARGGRRSGGTPAENMGHIRS
jgi:hypothetical protein